MRRALAVALLAVAVGALGGCRRAPVARGPWHPSALPRIDVHTHILPGGTGNAVAMLAKHGVVHCVNLSGGTPARGLEQQLAEAAATHGRITIFANAEFREASAPGYGPRMAAWLARAHEMGAKGLKIPKGLGLGYTGPDGKLLAVDDPELDALFETAGRLGMPVTIHSGDPKAFWLPATPANERFDELRVHPGWSFYGQPVPSWAELYAAFQRRVARHPGTKFIGAHFGNDPEDPDAVADMLAKYPNLYVDTAARIPELGRHDPAHMRALFVRFKDRILFGSDGAWGPDAGDLMLGSSGENPPTPAEVERFWTASWRWFETDDKQFEHPTPIQGNWKIDGIALPDDVLAAVYAGNAERLIGIKLH